MFLILITLILNQVNASTIIPKDGTYSYKNLNIEINVKNGAAVSARVYDNSILLTKKGDGFYGEGQNQDLEQEQDQARNRDQKRTTSVEVNTNDKKSLLVNVEEKLILPNQPGNRIYKFEEMGLKLIVENNLISTLYTGIEKNQTNRTELKLDNNGKIASYSISSISPYTLKVENSQIDFWCEDCAYKIGPTKSSIEIADNYYLTCSPNTIEIYSSDGIKKIIDTDAGKYINTSIFFFEGSDLLSSSTQFIIDEDKVIYKNSSKFITRKSNSKK